jgi:hypothetical protein
MVLCFCFVCIVSMLPVSLNCQILIAPSIFSDVYLNEIVKYCEVIIIRGIRIFVDSLILSYPELWIMSTRNIHKYKI